MSSWQRLLRSVLGIAVAGGIAAALVFAEPRASGLPHSISTIPGWYSDAPVHALLIAVAAVAWVILLWLCVGVAIGSLAALPGAVGRGAGQVARWMLPRALHRALELSLGLTLVAGSASGLLSATPALADGPPTAVTATMPSGTLPGLSPPSTAARPAPPSLAPPTATGGSATGITLPNLAPPGRIASATSTPSHPSTAAPVRPTTLANPTTPAAGRSATPSASAPSTSTPARSTPAASTSAASGAAPTSLPPHTPIIAMTPATPTTPAPTTPTAAGGTTPWTPSISSPPPSSSPPTQAPAHPLAPTAPLGIGMPGEQGTDEVVVHRGDTLWSIAARHLGPGATDAQVTAEWRRWWAANHDQIGSDPNLIHPGQRLRPPAGP